jgi:hypothetical protein
LVLVRSVMWILQMGWAASNMIIDYIFMFDRFF